VKSRRWLFRITANWTQEHVGPFTGRPAGTFPRTSFGLFSTRIKIQGLDRAGTARQFREASHDVARDLCGFSADVAPPEFQTGILLLLGAAAVHAFFVALAGKLPRIAGIFLIGAYAWFVYDGLLA
jgi:hypothetical protein